MDRIKKIYNLLAFNFNIVLKFSVLYFTLITLLTGIVLGAVFSFALKFSGNVVLTLDTLKYFITNPLVWPFLLLLFLIITFSNFYYISTIIIIFDKSHNEEKIDLYEALCLGAKHSIRVIKPYNFLIAVLIFILPTLAMTFLISGVSTDFLPEFIADFISANKLFKLLSSVLGFISLVLLLLLIYVFHYFIIDGDKCLASCKKSIASFSIYNILSIVISGMTFLLFVLAISFGIIVEAFIASLFGVPKIVVFYLAVIFLYILILEINFLYTPSIIAIISVNYYELKDIAKKKITKDKIILKNEKDYIYFDKKKNEVKSKKIFNKIITILGNISLILLCTSIIIMPIIIYNCFDKLKGISYNFASEIEVTAHRGGSSYAPENTMSAFKNAVNLNANWIELDITLSKDGKVFVIHDSNFSRTGGVDKDVWELTWDEISKLDAGEWFDEMHKKDKNFSNLKFKGEKFPLLEEVLALAKSTGIKLNIEIKRNGHDEGIVEKACDLINLYDLKDRTAIASLDPEVLKDVKKYDKNIKTLYNMTLAIGDLSEFDYVDIFSVEFTSATEKLSDNVHNLKKKICAWTVNKEENMQEALLRGIDNIVTDNVIVAKEIVMNKEGNDFNNLLVDIMNWVKEK